MKRQYENYFSNWDDLVGKFTIGWYDEDNKQSLGMDEPEYIYAFYDISGYEGTAYVVFTNDGETFGFVEAGHCSCYGLEEQWDPTYHSLEEILKMSEPEKDWYYGLQSTGVREWLKENNLCV